MYKLPQLPHDQFAAFVCALFNQLLDDDFTLNENGKLIESASGEVTILAVPLSIEQFKKEAIDELKTAIEKFILGKNKEYKKFIIATNYALDLDFQDYLDKLKLEFECIYLDWESVSILADNPLKEFDFIEFYPKLNFKQLPYDFENGDDKITYYQAGILIKNKVLGEESNDVITTRTMLIDAYENQGNYVEALQENKKNAEFLQRIVKSGMSYQQLELIVVSYSSLGTAYYKLGDYNTGLKWFKELALLALPVYSPENDIWSSITIGLMAGFFYTEAQHDLLLLFTKIEDVLFKENSLIPRKNLGTLYFGGIRVYDNNNNNNKAFTCFKALWKLLENQRKEDSLIKAGISKKVLEEEFPQYYKQLVSGNHIVGTTENNQLSKSSTELPFSIKQVHIKAFQAIRDLKIETIPVDAQWIFITGKNGTGKSSLLQALALGLLGETVEEYNLLSKKQETVISIELLQDGNNQIQTLKVEDKQSEFYQEEKLEDIPMPVLTYGVSRLKIQKEEEVYDENTMINLFSAEGGDLSNIEKWLKDKALEGEGDSKQVKMVFDTLSSLMPSVSHIERNKSQIEYTENGEVVTRERLASGNKSILAMVGDILIRLLRFYPNTEETEDFKGIIIIDELDLHLHPSWQREMPWLLSKLFPKVQFICSTHSIIPFMGAPKNSVFFTVDRTEEEGTTIRKLDIDVSNLSANILLSSPLFEVSLLSKVAEEEGKSQEYRTESGYEEYDENVKNSAEFKKLQEKYGDILGDKLFKK